MRTLAILMLITLPVSTATVSATARQQALTVLVGDHVGLDRTTLRKAAELAGSILHEGGVLTEWTTCPKTEPGRGSLKDCLLDAGRPDLVLWILPKAPAGHPVLATAMGMALPGPSGATGTHAFIYYDRVRSATQFSNCDAFRILGHAIAHEIGHLLGNRHSNSGIMRADWSRGDLTQMSRGHVLFNSDEGRWMSANAAARAPVLQASR